MEMPEKILILTLGTGSILDWREAGGKTLEERKKIISEKAKKKEFCYRSCTYTLEDLEIKTEFVAEPLVQKFHPQHVFILGTVKSAWTSFYTKFSREKTEDDSEEKNRFEENVLELYQIEDEHGYQTDEKTLEGVEKQINDIYHDSIVLDSKNPAIQVTAVLTRYGITQEELLSNYQKISYKLGSILESGKKYEVAFDITHSFRSLPLYNLVILNYFKYVTQYDIDITHVYYGNVEVSRETDGNARIVDLKDLVDVLKLTNGINEFKNTGNAITLLSLLEDERLCQALKKFDWAMQLNAFNLVEDALEEVLCITQEPSEEKEGTRYEDLKNMLALVIKEKFFGQNGISYEKIQDFKDLSMAEKQYILSRWYLQQNRYGQAIVTALETLRSYLVPMYLKLKEEPDSEEKRKNENNRRAAVDRIKMIKNNAGKETGKKAQIEKIFCDLESVWEKVKNIRDEFAHNLEEREKNEDEYAYDDGQAFGDMQQMQEFQAVSSKKYIENFIQFLGELREEMRNYPELVYEIYAKNHEEVKKKVKEKNIRLIITTSRKKDDYDKYQSSLKKKYTVYRLPDNIIQFLSFHTKQEKETINKAVFLVKYIQKYFDETADIILSTISLKELIHFAPVMKEKDWNIFYEMQEEQGKVGKLGKIPNMEFGTKAMLGENDGEGEDAFFECGTNNLGMEEYFNMAPIKIDG